VFCLSNSKDSIHKKEGEKIQKMAETTGDTIFAVLNKLAGGGNNLKVDFEGLTLGAGPLEARVDGAIVLDVVLPK
jgi:hypothetical protein